MYDSNYSWISSFNSLPLYINTGGNNVIMNASGGSVGIGTTSPAGLLHLHTTGLDQSLFLSSAAPSLKLMNNPVLGSATMVGILAMATSNGHFGLNAGDILLGAYSNSHGNIYINSNYSGTGTTNVILQPTSGNVGIGTPTPGATLHVNGGAMFAPTAVPTSNGGVQIDGGANGRIYIARTNADTVEEFYYVGVGRVGSISLSSSATTYNTASDRRLKENFADSKRGLDALMNIPVQDFNFIADKYKKRVQGFIAQDLYKVYPEAVTVGGDDPKQKPWAVDYGRLTPLLVKSIQELKADNDNLRTANDDEYAQIKILTARLDALEKAKR